MLRDLCPVGKNPFKTHLLFFIKNQKNKKKRKSIFLVLEKKRLGAFESYFNGTYLTFILVISFAHPLILKIILSAILDFLETNLSLICIKLKG